MEAIAALLGRFIAWAHWYESSDIVREGERACIAKGVIASARCHCRDKQIDSTFSFVWATGVPGTLNHNAWLAPVFRL